MAVFTPKLTTLPAPQRAWWSALGMTPRIFTLYGGIVLTALDVTRLPTLTPFAKRPAP